MTTAEKVQNFFNEHSDATEVHEALGKLFSEKEKAQRYLAGVSGRMVTTHTREGVNYERVSDELYQQIVDQENLVGKRQIAYEEAPPIEKEKAMGEWKAAQDKLAHLKARYEKQLRVEEKDELLAKEEKPTSIPDLNYDPTLEELQKAVESQEIIVREYKAIAGNEKLSRSRKKGAEKAVEEAEAKLQELLKQLENKQAEEDKDVEEVDHLVTEEDLAANPELAEAGVNVGDTIKVPMKKDNNPGSGDTE